ncbi:MAG: hypothetical protein V1763_02160 [Parcubacteria group bacterium]
MSKIISNLIHSIGEVTSPGPVEEKIVVNTVLSKAALAYEKVRNVLDYKEEHLFRKNAIYRILKRKLVLERVILENYLLDYYHQDNVAEHLLRELIRGGYLIGDVPLKMIEEVDAIILKYNLLFNEIKKLEGRLERKRFDYLMEMEAVEIEDLLIPATKEKALVRAMFSVMNSRLQLGDVKLDEKVKEMQLYLACHRALYKWDEGMLRHLLLTLYYPGWNNADKALIEKVANNINKIQLEMESQLNHPWRREIGKIVQRQAVVFWTIQDMIEVNDDDADAVFSNPEKLESEVKKSCERRYKTVRTKLFGAVARSIVYVFFTKMILALAIEFPVDYYLSGGVNYFTSAINISFPPLLMLIVAISIRFPKKENTAKILDETKQIVFGSGEEKKYVLKAPRKRGIVTKFIFNLIYIVTFLFSIAVICWLLYQIHFNVASAFIFVLFLTLVSYFGIRIRRPVQEIMAVERRATLSGALIEFFALPFVSMGRWMSGKFSKINFIIFFLDFIIEAPFKLLINVIEDLFGFLKEKKDEAMGE